MQSRAGRIIIRTFTVIFGVIIILAAFIFRAYDYGFNYTKGEEIPDKVTITDDGNGYDTVKLLVVDYMIKMVIVLKLKVLTLVTG